MLDMFNKNIKINKIFTRIFDEFKFNREKGTARIAEILKSVLFG